MASGKLNFLSRDRKSGDLHFGGKFLGIGLRLDMIKGDGLRRKELGLGLGLKEKGLGPGHGEWVSIPVDVDKELGLGQNELGE